MTRGTPPRRPPSPSDERGATLVELVASLAIGLLVLLAGFVLLDRAVGVSQEIGDRQEAVQRGRQAMELITRQLRSQVCLGEAAEPIAYGDDGSVTFYADLGDGTTNVERRTLEYEPSQGSSPGRILQHVEAGVGIYPDLQFDAESATATELLRGVEPAIEGGSPVPAFRYYAFAEGAPSGDMQQLATPLSPTDASRTVMVRIAFATLPDRRRPRDRDATTLQDDVYVRIADPSRPLEGPRCV